ncbi:O-antigen/teichoic acid export membrane protein [Flavobacterium sp. CG_9.10]|uniref:oligosaccharide flippase family protein n=1 Tax=Flavobacterium sp. CG_9.10 TaxID=2787729 RepID=UPI0018CA37BD|nr:oligosaccharide flippase family protein [Flavobacterium sp. CG_9.10]MBG6111228.1 O-antigen/teichoic acid export membrane protein [Flavobacterium sp. CG_9.10]
MSESKSSYLEIVKTTSLFGGVQFFNIIISIIRTKLIAVFIGPAGMGIISLLNASVAMISGITGLGIETSAIKHVSGNYKNEDLNTVSTIVAVVKKLALLTGIFGTLLTIIFSGWLSTLTFGNSNHTYSFVFLSITLLFRQLMIGELAVLQGLRQMKLLAKANFYGNLFGLLFSIPLYVFYRIDAIVPTIIIASLSSLLFSGFYSKKIKFKKITLSNKQVTTEGKSIIRLGIMLTLSGLLTLLSTYLIQLYIGKNGGLVEVGYFNAGFTLLNSYVGIIFTVMSTDYFPKLASINDDNEKIRVSVVQQSFISILIITPIIILFLAMIPLIIKIIYTPAFISIIPMVSFGILAMLFRAVSWSMGYILIAKGDSKMFMKTAIGFNILSLILNILGYNYYGLEGLGFSFLVYYLFHFFVLKMITKKRYNFYFKSDFYQIYLSCILMCMTMFLFRYIPNPIIKYSLMIVMVVVSFAFVLFQMNKKMELKELFNSIIRKKND